MGIVKKACVYTTLIGDYEELNELHLTSEQSIPYICITDNPSLKSDTWQIRLVEPAFPMDSVRSQRRIKMLAHEYLPDFDVSLYIDNSVRLNVAANKLIEKMLEDADIAIPGHSFRESVYDEFVIVAKLGLDDTSRIFEQLNHYQLSCPDILTERPFWSAILFRRHGKPEVQAVMSKWYEHVARYSRRDQLSFNVAMLGFKGKIRTIDVDNAQSWFHTYPVVKNRRTIKRQKNMMMSGAPTMVELKLLEHDLEDTRLSLQHLQEDQHQFQSELLQLKMNNQQLQSNYHDILHSSSWKMTYPLRKTKSLITNGVSRLQLLLHRYFTEINRYFET